MAKLYEERMKAKYLPFKMGRMTEELTEQSKKELNETDEVKDKALKEFRKRVQALDIEQPDDSFLVEFLRPRKFDVDRALKLLMSFFDVKKEYSEIFANVDFDEVDKVAKTGLFTFLPFRAPDGCTIMLIELSKWDTSSYDLVKVARMVAIVAMLCLEDIATQVSGVKIIVNAKGASLKIIRFFTPRYITLLSKALRNCLPIRFKGIHLVNETFVLQYVLSLLKIFLSDKIKNRIHFHSENMKSLHNFIPKELLTEEYGGCNKYFDHGETSSKLISEGLPRIKDILRFGHR